MAETSAAVRRERFRRRFGRAGGVALAAAVTALLAVPFAPPATAAVTPHQRQIAVGANAQSAATFSLAVPAGVSTVAGEHLVVAYLFSGSSFESVTSVTDSRGNSYRVDARQTNAGSSGLQIVIASARIATALSAGDTVTVQQNNTTTYHAMQVYEFDNFNPTTWVDKTATGNGSTATTSVTTASTATTSQANETLFAAVGFGDNTATLTSAGGWTQSDTTVAGAAPKQKSLTVAARDVTATGPYSYAGQLSTAMQSVSALVTYRTVTSSPPTAPVASFTASPTSGAAPLAVQFTDGSTGPPTSWSWTFGDGGTSTLQSPLHQYAAAGTYSVTLTVANAVGSNTLTRSGLISVAAGAIGFMDMSTQGAGGAATGEKPESKLWWNAGSWWGVLFDSVSQTYHIFRLNRTTETWADTGVLVDNRPKSRADTLWDGQHLYVASHLFASSSATAAAGNPARLSRYSYDSTAGTYRLDAGFPVDISGYSSETLTIDKDSTGRIWATWTLGSQVYVNATAGSDTTWGTPFVLPATGATGLSSDDISAVVAYGGNRIGVMWSNQVASAMYFAEHDDADPTGTWQTSRTAVQGPNQADDHINLKALEGDSQGRVFAAVKTSLDETGATAAPQILVLSRDPATGDWSSAVFGRVSDCHTRPVLVLDSQHGVLHVFATAPDSGCPFAGSAGTIFEKTSPMSAISFPLGRGTPVIRDPSSPNMNNVTTTKQSVTDATGLVVMASDDVTKKYWHADVALG